MTTDSLPTDLANATASLLKMAREMSWNHIAEEALYKIREIDPAVNGNLVEQNRNRKHALDAALVLTAEQAVGVLRKQFMDIHLIELFVFKALPNQTLIEIAVLKNSRLEPASRTSSAGQLPMLNCKVAIPPYHDNPVEKFDIHWSLNFWEYRFKMFWWRLKGRFFFVS